MNDNDFYLAVYEMVRTIPSGKVMTYGQVARALGKPMGARLVGWALRALPTDTDVPWQRVVAKDGKISIINPAIPQNLQAELIESEGLAVVERNGELWIEHPVWHS